MNQSNDNLGLKTQEWRNAYLDGHTAQEWVERAKHLTALNQAKVNRKFQTDNHDQD